MLTILIFLSVLFLKSMSYGTTNKPNQLQTRDDFDSSLYSGRGTWFYPGLGACGAYATQSDFIVALSHTQYEDMHCYKDIVIINTLTGKATTAQIQDRCTGCDYGSIDMSPALFDSIADDGLDEGVLSVAWLFADDFPEDPYFDDMFIRRSLQTRARNMNETLAN